ncbi:fungal-specific transcription factor domain-containing protein [Fusarium oxysporum f. sp. albedinis]|nr:fungal-specific transcription factor domain-containing protein [Fusarium oxysporum f. sp. albedinis]KAK2484337.1 hypothetical protein H9L39_06129 [Fusarium oxysporum f. sp. albedinis]
MTLQCTFCNQDFRRSEHLERHLLRHIGARPFACTTCGADFARRDTLLRHVRSHAQPPPALPGPGSRHRRVCVPRACRPCAESKQKCDGRDPCLRCVGKQRTCVYVADQRRSAHRLDTLLSPDPGPSLSGQREAVQGIVSRASETSEAFEDSCEPASPHPVSTKHPNLLASSFGLPDEVSHQLGISVVGGSPLANGTSWLTDWYPELPVTLSFMNESYNAAEGSNGTRTEGFQGNASNQIVLDPTNWPSARAPRPIFTSDQELDMVITNQPPPVGLWPSHRPATHHPLHQQPSDQTVTEVTDPTDHVTANDLTWKIEDYHHVPALGQQTYSVMCVHFATLNADNGFHQAFTDKPFPTYEVTAAFVQAYFEHFQPLFPIIHQPNFNPRETPWILTLAVAVIGSRYSVLGVDSSVLHLHEFLRRSINLWNERGFASDPSSHLCLAQATVLNQIGMMFSGSMEMAEHAQKNMSHVALICKKASDPSRYRSYRDPADCPRQVPEEWETWVYAESCRRLAYLSWLVDCQLALYFDLSPTLPIDLLRIPMPSSQALWAAELQDSWVSGLATTPDPSVSYSLRQALDELYVSRKVPNHCTELTRLLLTVGVYFDEQRGPDAGVFLDVLRRDEDEMTGSDRLGWLALEHNHILSLLLHLPLRELMAFSGWRVSEVERSEADFRLARWVRNEGAGARLVIYHAAKVYSCIRERPFAAYSGTMAFLTATLAIWAVTMSVNRSAQPSWPSAEDHSFGQGRLKTLRFDRFTDRSTIIDWVSGKENVRPYLAGVGALEGSMVAPLLIRESVRVLRRKLSCMFSDAVSRILQFHFESRDYIATLV